MQKMLGYMRRAIKEYDMIKDGDCIAAGISTRAACARV